MDTDLAKALSEIKDRLAEELSGINSRVTKIEAWKELLDVIAANTVYNGRYATKDDVKSMMSVLAVVRWALGGIGLLLVALLGWVILKV